MPRRPLLPSEQELQQRLVQVEQQLADIEARLKKRLTQAERAGCLAHQASLSQRRRWYLSRIRTTRPVTALGVEVDDEIHTREAHP